MWLPTPITLAISFIQGEAQTHAEPVLFIPLQYSTCLHSESHRACSLFPLETHSVCAQGQTHLRRYNCPNQAEERRS